MIAALALLALAALAGFWLYRRAHRIGTETLEGERNRLLSRLGDSEKQRAALLARAETAERERTSLRAIIEALPVPVWRRRIGDLKLVGLNRAYAEAVDADAPRALEQGLELAGPESRALAGRARDRKSLQRERRHVVVEGARRLLELLGDSAE